MGPQTFLVTPKNLPLPVYFGPNFHHQQLRIIGPIKFWGPVPGSPLPFFPQTPKTLKFAGRFSRFPLVRFGPNLHRTFSLYRISLNKLLGKI